MAEIRKLKIERKSYSFDIKKKYQLLKRFKVREKRPIDALAHGIFSVFSKKKEEKKAVVAENPVGGFNPLIMGGALILVLLLFAGVFIYFALQAQKSAAELVKPPIKGELDFSVKKTGVVTAGDRITNENAGYVRLAYQADSIQYYNMSLTIYQETLPSEVFVLLSEREQAQGYSVFIETLRSELSRKGVLLNEITVEQLETLPGGAIVIIPSGVMPQELLGVNSRFDVGRLAENGNVVIYIGLPFNKMLKGSTVVSTPPEALAKLPFKFDENVILQSSSGFKLNGPRYSVNGASGYEIKQIFGSVSVAKRGNGAVLFLPQTIDGGWLDDELRPAPALAGKDVARLILETPWAEPELDKVTYNVPIEKKENITEASGMIDFFTNGTFKGNQKTMKLEYSALTESGNILQGYNVLQLKKESLGSLYTVGGYTVVPKVVEQKDTILDARLREQKPEEKVLYISITENGEETGERIPLNIVNVQTDLTRPIPLELDSGDYIASIIDDEKYIYAQTYLKVVFVEVKYLHQVGKGRYLFSITKDGKPISLKTVNATVENGKYGSFGFSGLSQVVVDVTNFTGGEDLNPAKYKFTFTFGKISKTVEVTKQKPAEIIPTQFVVVGVFALLIISAGLYLARRESVGYMIDIPDFPPVTKTKVPLSKAEVLEIFQRVNDDYRWKTTPLTAQEVKNGFKKIFYQGKPVFITDYNVEYLLEELRKRGDISEYLNYYGLVSWEQKTGHSLFYLSIFRKLRDIFVNNAIPFTALEEEENCDTKISAVSQSMYVHIFDKNADPAAMVGNILKSLKGGINILIFKNDSAKRDFLDVLASPTAALSVLKLEVEAGSVQLQTIDEFEKMIIELKSF